MRPKFVGTKSKTIYGHRAVRKYYSDKSNVTTIRFHKDVDDTQIMMVVKFMNLLGNITTMFERRFEHEIKVYKTFKKIIIRSKPDNSLVKLSTLE